MQFKKITIWSFILVVTIFLQSKSTFSQINDLGTIDLKEALTLSLKNNPEIKAFLSNIEAKDGLLIQSGLYPNSEINVEIENFGGSGAAQGFNEAETTILISQLIPIYGKIGKKVKVSRINKNIAELEYESNKLDVFLSTKKSFLDVLSNQEKLSLTEQLVNISEQVNTTISQMVEAGKESPIEEKKSSIEYEQTKLLLTKIKREIFASKKRLAENWGDINKNYSKVKGNLYTTNDIPSLEKLLDTIENNPDIKILQRLQDLNNAKIKLQRALAVPDPTIGIGYRRLSSTDDNAIVAEFSIPIPFFNRNQGNIKASSFNLTKSSLEYQNFNTITKAKIAEKYESLKFFISEIETLEEDILPNSVDAYSSILEGYREGKFEYLNVLDSQRTLFNSKLQYINALTNYHKLKFEIERLTGTELSTINSNGDS